MSEKKYVLVAPSIELRLRHDEFRDYWVEHSYLEGEIPVRGGIAECKYPETAEYLKSLGYTPIEEADPKILRELGIVADRNPRPSSDEV